MKLSVDLYRVSERFGDYKAIELVKEAGFDGVDYSYYYNKECEQVLGSGYREYAKNLRAHLDNVGLPCVQAHAPFSLKYHLEKDVFNQKYNNLIRSIESASILGAENIVFHTLTVPDGVDFEEYNIEYFKGFIPYCEKFGIRIAVENLFVRDKRVKVYREGKLGNPKDLNRFIDSINSPWIVACVDTGHAALTGYEPEKFIEGLTPGILKALHVQDNDYLDDRHLMPYAGNLNWQSIMCALKNTGYTGYLNYEISKFFDKFPNELFADVLKLSESVGRHLISIYTGK